ncbi:MAG: DUF3800 domain-containing protein [Rhodocyclaceae bacterium]|nr:DUF3800 domain-containing protein [Rhodocyclaceae bacterium]MBP7081609.1 DUF3800 domain-containing protein [Rhodocyclaceae bacterium]
MSETPLHYFVDEAGDTTLFGRYGKERLGEDGVSRFFIVGRLEVDDAEALEADLNKLRTELLADPLLNSVPSMQPERQKTALFFHAKDDVPEVRLQVFRVLRQHGVRFSAVVKDKLALLESVRVRQTSEASYRYRADGHELYDSMMRSLFRRVGRFGHYRHITFAVRGNKPRTHLLTNVLTEVEQEFEKEFGLAPHKETTVRSGYPWDHAGLQACDYFLWALQRFYERGEDRFLNAMWSQFVEVIDLDLPAPKQRGKPRNTSVVFNEEHPLTLESRAGVGIGYREI